MQPLMREPSAHACLMNVLAVSEFLATFGVLCEASRLSLQEVQQAAASFSHSSALAQLYASLLRCVLLEKVHALRLLIFGMIISDCGSIFHSSGAQSKLSMVCHAFAACPVTLLCVG